MDKNIVLKKIIAMEDLLNNDINLYGIKFIYVIKFKLLQNN
jgi:hypothetical protein